MFYEVYDTDSLVLELSELTFFFGVEVSNMARCASKTNELGDIDSIG